MTAETFIVNSEETLKRFQDRVKELFTEKKHIRFSWIVGAKRSLDQNGLSFAYYRTLAAQDGQADEGYYRATCKLDFGIPILCVEPAVKQQFLMLGKYKLTREDKLSLMLEPFNIPVTSLMNRKQFSEYIEKIERQWPSVDFTAPKKVWGYD